MCKLCDVFEAKCVKFSINVQGCASTIPLSLARKRVPYVSIPPDCFLREIVRKFQYKEGLGSVNKKAGL